MDNIQVKNIIDPLMNKGYSPDHYDDFIETIVTSGVSVREFKSVVDSAVMYRPRNARTFDTIQSLADAIYDEADSQELPSESALWIDLAGDLFDISKRHAEDTEAVAYTSGVPIVKTEIPELRKLISV